MKRKTMFSDTYFRRQMLCKSQVSEWRQDVNKNPCRKDNKNDSKYVG